MPKAPAFDPVAAAERSAAQRTPGGRTSWFSREPVRGWLEKLLTRKLENPELKWTDVHAALVEGARAEGVPGKPPATRALLFYLAEAYPELLAQIRAASRD